MLIDELIHKLITFVPSLFSYVLVDVIETIFSTT